MNGQKISMLCLLALTSESSGWGEEPPPKPKPSRKATTKIRQWILPETSLMEAKSPVDLPKLSDEPREVLTSKLKAAIKNKELAKQAELEYQLGRLINEKWAGHDYERGVLVVAAPFLFQRKETGLWIFS